MDKHVWRPTINDVERISWGKPAKKKGTGSRGVPHRLNQDERFVFELARRRGYLELDGSGWRSQRREAPLLNTYRSLCDARGQVSIVLHKSSTGTDDAIVCDISPLRNPTKFDSTAQTCLETIAAQQQQQHQQHDQYDQPPSRGTIVFQGSSSDGLSSDGDDDTSSSDREEEEEEDNTTAEDLSMTLSIVDGRMNDNTVDDENDELTGPWETRPIYQLPPYCISWETLQRTEAKTLGKALATLFSTIEEKKTNNNKNTNNNKSKKSSSSKKPIGVKAGKNRRHGGYGIG